MCDQVLKNNVALKTLTKNISENNYIGKYISTLKSNRPYINYILSFKVLYIIGLKHSNSF